MKLGLLRGALVRGGSLPYRNRITGKKGNVTFYKGKGGNKGGKHTKSGRYIIDPAKLKFLQVPDLTGFKLTPYVSHETPKYKTVKSADE